MIKILFVCLVFSVFSNGSLVPRFSVGMREARIVGGEDAPDGGIPYQVSLRTMDNEHFCGGSILNNRWVLTAAQCSEDESRYTMKVVVGTNRLTEGGDIYEIDTIIIHKDYNGYQFKDDISVIKVAKEIQFSSRVQPINLPEHDTVSGVPLLMSGWGTLTFPGYFSDKLQMINLTALSVNHCRELMIEVNSILDSQICSLTKSGEGACQGDSGSPLAEEGKVVGIVSWGMPCARGYPDVHTRVYYYKDWILENIEANEESISLDSE